MFDTIEAIIKDNPTIEKIILMDRTPQFDALETDPNGLKPELALYGNNLNEEFRNKSALKDKIVIGKHTILCNYDTYGHSDKFYGIHMYGKHGVKPTPEA